MYKTQHTVKKKIVHKKIDSTVTFVKVDSPLAIRKGVLESAIKATSLLREYERYKAMREEKAIRMKQLVEIFNEIEALFRKLRTSDLPIFDKIETELKKSIVFREQMFEPPKHSKNVVRPKDVVRVVEVKKPLSVEEKLDLDIKDIEDKLNNLSL